MALYKDKIPILNFCLALPPSACKPTLVRVAKKVGKEKWNVINLVFVGDLKIFNVALCHDKVPDLNSYIALLPSVSSARRGLDFGKIIMKYEHN
jgi:hypothetical protein